jgi:tRNA (guanine37-N1)-methyltransferase
VAAHYRDDDDVRVVEASIGDYVLAGGEVAALVMIEAVTRLIPGVLGNAESLVEESHGSDGLLEYPVYTKPPSWRGLDVPEILFSGHHANIAAWRHAQSLARTKANRPDLLP